MLFVFVFRVTVVVEYLDWFDVDLGCSTSLLWQELATEVAHQPGETPYIKVNPIKVLNHHVGITIGFFLAVGLVQHLLPSRKKNPKINPVVMRGLGPVEGK